MPEGQPGRLTGCPYDGWSVLTACMPWTAWRLAGSRMTAFAQVSGQAEKSVGDRGCPLLPPGSCLRCAPTGRREWRRSGPDVMAPAQVTARPVLGDPRPRWQAPFGRAAASVTVALPWIE